MPIDKLRKAVEALPANTYSNRRLKQRYREAVALLETLDIKIPDVDWLRTRLIKILPALSWSLQIGDYKGVEELLNLAATKTSDELTRLLSPQWLWRRSRWDRAGTS